MLREGCVIVLGSSKIVLVFEMADQWVTLCLIQMIQTGVSQTCWAHATGDVGAHANSMSKRSRSQSSDRIATVSSAMSNTCVCSRFPCHSPMLDISYCGGGGASCACVTIVTMWTCTVCTGLCVDAVQSTEAADSKPACLADADPQFW